MPDGTTVTSAQDNIKAPVTRESVREELELSISSGRAWRNSVRASLHLSVSPQLWPWRARPANLEWLGVL